VLLGRIAALARYGLLLRMK